MFRGLGFGSTLSVQQSAFWAQGAFKDAKVRVLRIELNMVTMHFREGRVRVGPHRSVPAVLRALAPSCSQLPNPKPYNLIASPPTTCDLIPTIRDTEPTAADFVLEWTLASNIIEWTLVYHA